ncbi:MAG: hypothetical protein Q7T20_03990 [Saprospiraceae bacterium]|nr:hypothetical protein [Saprospiraceae bacterium]
MRHLACSAFLLFLNTTLFAQVFMRPFENAAAMGMGGATIAVPGLSTGLANEAQLGLGERLGFWVGSALPYGVKDWHTGNVQAVVGMGKYSGAGLGIEHSTVDVYAEHRFRLAYGRRLTEAFYLGGSADVLRASAQEYGSTTMATFGLSLLARALPDVWIGAKIQNPLQQKIGEDLVPTVLRIGASWKPSELLLMTFETEKDLERKAMVKAGVEYRPTSVLVIRAGMRSNKVARIAFGAGLRLKNNLAFDLASEWHPSLGLTPSAMISWRKASGRKQ